MSIILDLNPTKIAFIRDVCGIEHDSLMRLHHGTSEESPHFQERLEQLGLTQEEYDDYSSEAFFEFQKVSEDPTLIKDMHPILIAMFLEICELWKEELLERHPKQVYYEVVNSVMDIKQFKPTNLNLN